MLALPDLGGVFGCPACQEDQELPQVQRTFGTKADRDGAEENCFVAFQKPGCLMFVIHSLKIMEVEHRPLEDHVPLQGGPGQLP